MTDRRLREARRLWLAQENRWLYTIVGFLAGITIGPFITAREPFFGSLFPEAVGILFTILVIDRAYAHQEETKRTTELISLIGSGVNAVAKSAFEELRNNGRLFDGSLRGRRFINTDLSDTFLVNADLRAVILYGSILCRADLYGADLSHANLKAANLLDANLENVTLEGTNFDGDTILPDGTHYQVNEDMSQMNRFVFRNSENFWRSQNPNSPAYSAEDELL